MLNLKDKTTLLVISPDDLRAFALEIVEEVRKTSVENERLYPPKEFAQRHGVDVSTIWRWRKQGFLTGTKVGGKVWYKDSDLKKEAAI